MNKIEAGAEVRENMEASRVFAVGGKMAERMRALDWSQTPLGPVESWPQSMPLPLEPVQL